ncbi:ATP-dependent DNA helicase sgs1, partial [Serendipita sp. 398]
GLPQFQDCKTILEKTFACETFREGQLPAINAAIAGYDVVITLNTSAGKSLCYQLPAIYSDRLTVVFSPTVALIEDQVRRLHELKHSEAEKNGLAIRSHSRNRQDNLIDPSQGQLPKMFYVCPEWLGRDDRKQFLHQLCREECIARFVIDEAHMALRKFRVCYRFVFELRKLFPKIPFTLVSASTTQNELKVLTKELGMYRTCLRVLGSLDRPNIHYRVIHVPVGHGHYRDQFIVDYVRKRPRECGIVFVRTRAQAEKVAENLQSLLAPGSVVDYYHGKVPDKLTSILDRWNQNLINVIVCTCAFAEGIDKNDGELIH